MEKFAILWWQMLTSIARWLAGVSAVSHAELVSLAFLSFMFLSPWYFIVLHILLPFVFHCSHNSSPPIFSFLSIQNGCRVTGNLYLQNSLKNIRNNIVSWARYVSSLRQRPSQTVRPLRRLVLRRCWILCSRWGLLLLSVHWCCQVGCLVEDASGKEATLPHLGRKGSTREAT